VTHSGVGPAVVSPCDEPERRSPPACQRVRLRSGEDAVIAVAFEGEDLARLRVLAHGLRGRTGLLIGALALRMISALVPAFRLYCYFASLGVLDSVPATALVYIASPHPAGHVVAEGPLRRHPDGARRGGDDRRPSCWRAFRLVVLRIAVPRLAAGSVLAVLPAILLFVVLQRFIVGAFVAGALKG
jgi:ABC-type maltose transport system permease subunit